MSKYKDYVKLMLDEKKEEFAEFRKIHDAYEKDTNGLQREYNEAGSKIQDIVREYDDRLCRNTERGQYSTFSGGLSEKFHAEVKKIFPMIDHIGLVPQEPVKASPSSAAPSFEIKKIQL